GSYAIVGGASAVVKDIVPFAMAAGNRVQIQGVNLIGLKRHGIPAQEIINLKRAFKLIFHSKLNTTQALQTINEQIKDSPNVNRLVEFINNSQRGISK
ncbi:MAG: acyl-[acyl-carrier-protein]--UDP-N-acetylglucosamine O-acyltransferase, partial [Candidatus Schekmanbacteria bacterium]|nr:acyl-[acyl-carrier-protein]--UDP-N-acetylglucosamine O-acyltransferase [Candidatus Schekmanbacteria bacterium]